MLKNRNNFGNLSKILILVIIFKNRTSQYVYTKLSKSLNFTPTTPQTRIPMNIGNFDFIKQYTLWGWFRFNGETSAISNIITLRNIEPVDENDSTIGPYPNPNFEPCPITIEEMIINPSLTTQDEIKNNPNCFPQKSNIKSKGPDFLYINYDLNPPQNGKQTYSVVFLIQNGLAVSSNSDMKIEGFLDLPFVKNTWSYFGISANYESGDIIIFLKVFDGTIGNVKSKNFLVDFKDFKLKKFGELIYAGVENNPYFQSTSGFIGNISYVQMGRFFTTNLEILWMGFMTLDSYTYNGLIMNFLFQENPSSNTIASDGFYKESYSLNGNYDYLYNSDRNKNGIKFKNGAGVNFGEINFNNTELIKSFAFYFQFKYSESLPENYILLSRGTKGQNGYIGISFQKLNNHRLVVINIKGSKDELTWKGQTKFKPNTSFWFIIGIAISPSLSARLIYLDYLNNTDFSLLSESFIFDSSPLGISLLGEANGTSSGGTNSNSGGSSSGGSGSGGGGSGGGSSSNGGGSSSNGGGSSSNGGSSSSGGSSSGGGSSSSGGGSSSSGGGSSSSGGGSSSNGGGSSSNGGGSSSNGGSSSGGSSGGSSGSGIYNGDISFERFMVLNSSSAATYANLLKTTTNHNIKDLNKKCVIRASHYFRNFGCLKCKDSIYSNENKTCLNHCPENYKNALTDACVKCWKPNCEEIDTTKWSVQKINEFTYRFSPTRKILGSLNYKELLDIKIDGKDKSSGDFDYKLLEKDGSDKLTTNPNDQSVDINFIFNKKMVNKTLTFGLKNNKENPFIDKNRNLIYSAVKNVKLDRICFVNKNKKENLRLLAYMIIILYAISFIFLLLITIICCRKKNIGVLWKYFLSNWMKLQLVAFFLFLGVYSPCCVKEFLNILFKYAIRWNSYLSPTIDSINSLDSEYSKGIVNEKIPFQMKDEGVTPYLIHNIGISFIFHIILFFIYIILKIWDMTANKSSKMMYKLFLFTEYSMVVGGYLIVHFQIFVFFALNLKLGVFSHNYFTVCFLFSISYLLVFCFFWIYAMAKLFGKNKISNDPLFYNKFLIFFIGYKTAKCKRNFDLIKIFIHFFVGVLIAVSYNTPLVQITLIFLFLLVLFIFELVLRPWNHFLQMLVELLTQFLILFALAIFFIIAAYDEKNCTDCGDREGLLCWLIVIPLFLALIIGPIALFLQTLTAIFFPKKFVPLNDKKTITKKFFAKREINNNNINMSNIDSQRGLLNSYNPNSQMENTNYKDLTLYNSNLSLNSTFPKNGLNKNNNTSSFKNTFQKNITNTVERNITNTIDNQIINKTNQNYINKEINSKYQNNLNKSLNFQNPNFPNKTLNNKNSILRPDDVDNIFLHNENNININKLISKRNNNLILKKNVTSEYIKRDKNFDISGLEKKNKNINMHKSLTIKKKNNLEENKNLDFNEDFKNAFVSNIENEKSLKEYENLINSKKIEIDDENLGQFDNNKNGFVRDISNTNTLRPDFIEDSLESDIYYEMGKSLSNLKSEKKIIDFKKAEFYNDKKKGLLKNDFVGGQFAGNKEVFRDDGNFANKEVYEYNDNFRVGNKVNFENNDKFGNNGKFFNSKNLKYNKKFTTFENDNNRNFVNYQQKKHNENNFENQNDLKNSKLSYDMNNFEIDEDLSIDMDNYENENIINKKNVYLNNVSIDNLNNFENSRNKKNILGKNFEKCGCNSSIKKKHNNYDCGENNGNIIKKTVVTTIYTNDKSKINKKLDIDDDISF